METKRRREGLPIIRQKSCSFEGYDATSLMTETAKLRKLITKRGVLSGNAHHAIWYYGFKIFDL